MSRIENVKKLLEQARDIAEEIVKVDQINPDYLYNVRVTSKRVISKLQAILNDEVDVIYKSVRTQLQ